MKWVKKRVGDNRIFFLRGFVGVSLQLEIFSYKKCLAILQTFLCYWQMMYKLNNVQLICDHNDLSLSLWKSPKSNHLTPHWQCFPSFYCTYAKILWSQVRWGCRTRLSASTKEVMRIIIIKSGWYLFTSTLGHFSDIYRPLCFGQIGCWDGRVTIGHWIEILGICKMTLCKRGRGNFLKKGNLNKMVISLAHPNSLL